MNALVWAVNVLAWPAIHLSVAALFLRLPPSWFENDSWLTAPRRWEANGSLYRDTFAIRRWKALLPDGAPWLGGFSKKGLRGRDPAYLARFLLETRRAELAHWCMLACLPVVFLWNPPWARCVMALYALAANLPCIVAQRYNRLVLARVTSVKRHSLVLP
jgi:glycosyl-4,4'-diaponeurosporenoate acyltransferase